METRVSTPTSHKLTDGTVRYHVWVDVFGDERNGDKPSKAAYVAGAMARKVAGQPGACRLSSGGHWYGNGEFRESVCYSLPAVTAQYR